MADIDLKTATPDTSLPTDGFLFGADSQASASAPSVFTTQSVATTLLGSTSLTGATVTTSQPVLDLAQTWNASGVTFTGLKFNAATGSNAGSAAASLLMDLQLEGTSKFYVRKDASLGVYTAGLGDTAGNRYMVVNSNGVAIMQSGAFGWGSANAGGAADLILTRRAAANLRLGAADAAAPVAQTLSVQSVVAGTTNTAGTNLTITGSQGTGTGAGGSIIFQVAPAGSTGTAQNALATALTIDSTRKVTVSNGFDVSSGNSTFTATGFLAWPSRTYLYAPSVGAFQVTDNTGNNYFYLNAEAANTLALRNGTNPQTFRSYRSFTDASNYSRLAMAWNTSTALVMAEGAGTGSDGSVAFNDAALATNATVGFVMIPSCAGAPTGTPADIPTGQIPMVWDSTNLKLYVYTGGAWKSSAAFT